MTTPVAPTTAWPSALETESTAVCGWCGQLGQKAEMTGDGSAWYCAAVPAEDAPADVKKAYVDQVAACTLRGQLRREADEVEAPAEDGEGNSPATETVNEPATEAEPDADAAEPAEVAAEAPAGDAA